MSDMMQSFDTDPLMYELNNVLNDGLTKMLSKYVKRYNLLENTHKQIMNLPSVRVEMNRENDSDSDGSDDITPYPSNNTKDFEVMLAAHIDTIRNLRNEICELKESLSKRHVCNRCDNTCEQINIKLEIEDIISDDIKCTESVAHTTVADDEDDEDDIKCTESVAHTTVADDEDDEDEEEEDDEEEEEEDEDDSGVADKIVADKIVADKIVADKIVADKIVADKIIADKIIADKIVADKIVADKIVADTNDDVETENEEETDDFFEIEIDDVTYCTNDEETGIIYGLDNDGDVGKRVGYLKDGEPFFDNE